MKLTSILLRWKKPLPRGHIWRGKYRLYKEVTKDDLRLLKRAYDLEEKNMFYLRHPYLTLEQSSALTEPPGDTTAIENKKPFEEKQPEHKYLGDRLGILKVTDAWE